MLCNPKMCISRSNELHDIFTDGSGWHSEYLAFGSDEQPAKTAVKFGTIRDLLRVNNLLLFLCYEADNLEFMACLVISCLETGKWISLFLWRSVFLDYVWSVLWHLVSDNASAWHSSSQIHTIAQTDVSGALPRNSEGIQNKAKQTKMQQKEEKTRFMEKISSVPYSSTLQKVWDQKIISIQDFNLKKWKSS